MKPELDAQVGMLVLLCFFFGSSPQDHHVIDELGNTAWYIWDAPAGRVALEPTASQNCLDSHPVDKTEPVSLIHLPSSWSRAPCLSI